MQYYGYHTEVTCAAEIMQMCPVIISVLMLHYNADCVTLALTPLTSLRFRFSFMGYQHCTAAIKSGREAWVRG